MNYRERRYGKSTQQIEFVKSNPKASISCLTKESKSKLLGQGVNESQIICSEDNK